MIETQTINGRVATIAYMDANMQPVSADAATLVKVSFDDGEDIWLTAPGAPNAETQAAGWNNHRARQREPYRHFLDDAARINMLSAQQADHLKSADQLARQIENLKATSAIPKDVKQQVAAWQDAIKVLDESEPAVRDAIERRLNGVERATNASVVLVAVKRVQDQVATIRLRAIKAAFRLVRTRLGNIKIKNLSLAAWARAIADEDRKATDAAITSAVAQRFDSATIARKVVGTLQLQGVDGATQYTRLKLAHLGRSAIREATEA